MRKHFGWRVRIPVALLVVAVGLTIELGTTCHPSLE